MATNLDQSRKSKAIGLNNSSSHKASKGIQERGAIYTRPEVVGFILDLTGYTTDKPLYKLRILEPSFGEGDFLASIVERLLRAYKTQYNDYFNIVEDLKNAIRSYEVHEESIKRTRIKVLNILRLHAVSNNDAQSLLDEWIIAGDFLLAELDQTFTFAVGNPPYVRQERIPDELMAKYRNQYSTIYDRADLYVPFIERCLKSLDPGGALGFICSDRWMKNKYGGPLRAMVARNYHLACYVDMVDTPAFHSEVIAYPAITIIKRQNPGPTRIGHRPQIDSKVLTALSKEITADKIDGGSNVIEAHNVAVGHEPWILHSLDQLAVVRRLENEFPLLEETGCKVSIGVATGADKVFIGPFEYLDVEDSRKLPLVRTKDIVGGTVKWKGFGVINPFNEDGSLVNLQDFPRLARYFEEHADIILKRHCAEKYPKGWYRTIDRIYPELARQSKLLIPDIKGEANIVYEDGQLYPHHNLYFITSTEWDLKALQSVLRSGIAKLFVATYSTRMRGGYLRFQAQYLRRIRLPRWKDVPSHIKTSLVRLTEQGDRTEIDKVIAELYKLTKKECAAIGAGDNGD